MQKKLLAAAVLSALAGGVSAQSANVTLYGTLQGNFGFASSTGADTTAAAPAGFAGSTRGATGLALPFNANAPDQSTRSRMNPAGSNFGLRGTEDLGNGLSAWFQLELATTLGAPPPNVAAVSHGNTATYRNTAVGVRSNSWGSLSVGMWDTPFNLVAVINSNANLRTASAETGFQANLLGATTLGYGAWSAQNAASACTAAGGGAANAACFNYGTNFDRRERGGLMWWSPNWNGFEARVHYHGTIDANGVTANNRLNGGAALKPNIWSMSLAYANGPLNIAYGYERQNDLLAYAVNLAGGYAATGTGTGAFTLAGAAGAGAANMSGSKGTGHRLGGKYAFNLGGGSSIGVGAHWESLKWTMNYTNQAAAAIDLSELKKTAWRLQGNFTTGNHFFGLEYTRANNLKGSISGGNNFNGGGTEARGIILSYNYMMSKRTSLTAYYVDVKNESNANYSGLVFAGIATAAGADPKYYGVNLRHAF